MFFMYSLMIFEGSQTPEHITTEQDVHSFSFIFFQKQIEKWWKENKSQALWVSYRFSNDRFQFQRRFIYTNPWENLQNPEQQQTGFV